MIEEMQADLIIAKHEYNKLKSELSELKENLAFIDEEIESITLANKAINQSIDHKLSTYKTYICDIVNEGLRFIFDDDISISIHIVQCRHKTQYEIIYHSHIDHIDGGIESFGGGVSSVVSLLFRIVFILISKRIKFVFLDESLSMVSEFYQEKLSLFLEMLSDRYDFTIVLISHHQKIATHADHVLVVSKYGDGIRVDER